MRCLQSWKNCTLSRRQSVLISSPYDTAYIGFGRCQTWNIAEQGPASSSLSLIRPPVRATTPPKSWPISSAPGRRHRIGTKCQQSKVMCSHEVSQCANHVLVPKHLFVQLEEVERVADIIDSAFVPYRSCHARPVPPRSLLWKLVHNSAFAQLPYPPWANRSSSHRNLV